MTESTSGYPLSPPQKRLWGLIERFSEAPFRASCRVRLAGPLDRAVLERALATVIRQHEILRTRFARLSDMSLPFQVVDADIAVPLTSGDGAPESFDLERGPLLRATLHAVDGGGHELLLSASALVLDAESLVHLVGDLRRAYAGEERDEEPIQYPDIAHWLNELLAEEGEERELAEELWRRQLAPWRPATDLPFEHWPAEDAFAPRRLTAVFDPSVTAALTAAAERFEATAAAALQAVWTLLVARRIGRPELVTGLVSAGRRFAELEEALGLLARHLPIVNTVGSDTRFHELLVAVEECAEEVSEWHESFAWESLGPEDGETCPLPIAFEFRNETFQENGRGVEFRIVECHATTETFVLALRCEPGTAALDYDESRVTGTEASRLLRAFQTLAASASSRPEARLGELDELAPAERHQLLVEEGARCDDSLSEIVHRCFERQAELYPETLAVICEEESLSYAELNVRSNRLASYLRSRGVGPEVRVALGLERSPEMVVTIFAVMKAGGAYVPLDISLPSSRLNFLLDDSGVRVLLTCGHLANLWPEASGYETVFLDREEAEIAAQSDVNSAATSGPDNLAYIIYTSGSTGRPKGVAVGHRQLSTYVSGLSARLGSLAGASLATVSTFAADLGHTAVFGALCSGGTLHVISQERSTDPTALADYGERHTVDVLKIVPGHLRALLGSVLVSSSRPAAVLPRRWLVLGGEACDRALVQRARELRPGLRVLNHYGPTETTVGILTHEVPASSTATSVPLGRPLAGRRAILLDPRALPVPVWVAGEICLGGVTLARGYLGRPALTAERFVPDGFVTSPGMRLYRTGDLGRYLANGEIDFLGRVDDQVKVRGFRVEPGEIAAVLKEHPAVAEAAVLYEGSSDDGRLIAYLVPEGDAVDVALLRGFAGERLAPFMIPSAFVELEALPRTPNGKLDRAALPPPTVEAPRREGEPAALSTPLEEVVAGIWRGLLKVEEIGRDDNFFHLGGHSLLAIRMRSQLSEAFSVELLPLAEVFEAPTVAGLARALRRASGVAGMAPETPIEARPAKVDAPLSFAQERLWVLHRIEPESAAYNIFTGMELPGEMDLSILERSLGEILRRHAALRTSFVERDDGARQVVASEVRWSLPRVALAALPESARRQELLRLAAAEARRPFDLGQVPLLRALVIRLGGEEQTIFLTLHHIISDGWSMALLLRETLVVYDAFSRGEASPLPELEISYADYAVWQRRWLTGEVLERELRYWRRQLAGAPELLDLPTDRPRSEIQGDHGGMVTRALSQEVSERFEALCRDRGTTLFMGLVAAFDMLLFWATGRHDVVVGIDVANRDRPEVQGLIGFFVNQLVLRADLSEDPTHDELLAQVRRVTLEAYSHPNLPFEKLVAALNPRRSLSYAPLFQVKLLLQHTPFVAGGESQVEIRRLPLLSQTAQLDLLLNARQTPTGLRVAAEYSAELFDAATVERLLARFETVLDTMASEPGARLSALAAQLTQIEQQEQQLREEALEAASRDKLKNLRRTVARRGVTPPNP